MFRIIVDGELLEVVMYRDYNDAKKYAWEEYGDITSNIRVEKVPNLNK